MRTLTINVHDRAPYLLKNLPNPNIESSEQNIKINQKNDNEKWI